MNERDELAFGARTLGVNIDPETVSRLLRLLDELARWNGAYNLTAIVERPQMLTHHLLDSLAILCEVRGQRVADVGTGAGFPGLPLAICDPTRQYVLIDSNNKKVRFIAHMVRTLGLQNVEPLHARAETLAPAVSFDTVVARAFAALPELLSHIATLCGPATRVLAMKGRPPADELAAVAAPWAVTATRALEIPGLQGSRTLVILGRSEL